jgi:hypothetical protein
MLDDELLKLRLEPWLVDIEVFVIASATSMLLDELEIELEEVLMIASVLSTLDDEFERLSEEI